MDLIEYVTVLRRRWVSILTLAILGAAVGYGWSSTITPTYQTSSQVFVSVNSGDTVNDLVQGSTFTQNLVQSYTQLVATPAVLSPVIDVLSLETTPKKLAKSVQANTPLNTVIVEISVTDSNPSRAAEIANAIADQLPKTVTGLSPSRGGTTKSGEAVVSIKTIADATVPDFAISPNKKLRTLLGFVLGAVAGVALALSRRLLNTRVRGEGDLTAITDVPLIGTIPRWGGAESDRISLIKRPHSSRSESYRRLRSNLDFVSRRGSSATSVVVTSSIPQEGKTTTAVNLAVALAELGDRVLLMDADLRRPSVALATGLEGTIGLSTVLIGKIGLTDAVQKWGDTTLDVLTSGEIPPNPLHLIDSPTMEELIIEAQVEYDFLVVDSPPLLSVVDAAVISHQCDGPLIVAAAGKTKRKELASAVESLRVAGVTPVGMVLTRADLDEGRTYNYYTSPEAERGLIDRAAGRLKTVFSRRSREA